MNSKEKFYYSINNNKHVCIGLDTELSKIPKHLLSFPDPIYEFNKQIIDATVDNAGAYKINFAFYECNGCDGIKSLLKTVEHINNRVFTIADAKRGDIGNTSRMYASSLFDYFKFDASTLHPYMGKDSLEPFLRYEEKMNFILALTSNPGAMDFETLKLYDDSYLFERIISTFLKWNENNNMGFVIGATQNDFLEKAFSLMDDVPVLIPGIGKQGGDLNKVISSLIKFKMTNFLINSSRGIIYKSNTLDFANAAREEMIELNNKIIDIKQIFSVK